MNFKTFGTAIGTVSAALVTTLAAAGPASAQGRWELLGERTVGFFVDRDTVSGRGQGRFSVIRICVGNNAVQFREVEVIYRNGERQQLPVNAFVRPGQCTPNLELRGEARGIDQVNLVYNSVPNFRGQALVRVYGLHATMGPGPGPGPGGDRWIQLGRRMVGFERDRAEISGEGEGRFRAVRLCVARAPVRFRHVEVIFRNGERQELPVERQIEPGQCTPPLDLSGEARRIDRVVMVYRAVPNYRGEAAVTLYGLQ